MSRDANGRRRFDALLVDLDGTLLDGRGELHPENHRRIREAHEAGVRVMVATGRSTVATRPILDRLGLDSTAVVFNGAGVFCPSRCAMLEERVLSERTLRRLLAFGEQHDELTLVMGAERKVSLEPRDEHERTALLGLEGLEFVSRAKLALDRALRVSFLSIRHAESRELARAVTESIRQPVYVTHFPLRVLPQHRASRLHVVDVHAPCRGKAEALRVLEERYAIPPGRVVAVGDASNDVPMLRGAGLGVAMQDAMPEALAAADRVIGSHETPAIADLIAELFL